MFFATLRNRSPPGPTPQFADLHQIVSSNLARLRVLSQVARAPAPHPPRQCACLRSSSTAAPAPSQTRFASRRARTSGRDRARPMRRSCEPHCLASVPPDKYPRLLRTPASDCASLQTRCASHPATTRIRSHSGSRPACSPPPLPPPPPPISAPPLRPFPPPRLIPPNPPPPLFPSPLFFLVFPFLLLPPRRHNRATFPLGDKRQPPPVRRPFRRIARFLSSRQWKARPRRHVHQPNLPHVRILLPIRFAHSIRDKSPIRRDARPADRLQTQRFLQRRRMLRLRVERATAKKTKCHHQDPPNKFVHKAPLAYFNGVTQNPRTQTASAPFSKPSYRFFPPEPPRRFALINTSAESGRPFQKSSRTRPSASRLTVAGIALAVRYHPSGNTTALRGQPRLRSNTKSSPSKRQLPIAVYVSEIRHLIVCPFFTG